MSACSPSPKACRPLQRTFRNPCFRLVCRIGLHKRLGEFLSPLFQRRIYSRLRGLRPDTVLRVYKRRSAIWFRAYELTLSNSFPEVQPRALALYNMMRMNRHGFSSCLEEIHLSFVVLTLVQLQSHPHIQRGMFKSLRFL